MSDQTIHSPNEAKGKAIMVGDRGGLHTKDGVGPKSSQSFQTPFIAPVSILVGDGYDIAYFRGKDGYLVRYKGVKALDMIHRVKEEYDKTGSLLRSINNVRGE